MAVTNACIRGRILALCAARGAGKTCCPSEVARSLAPDWRSLMPRVREQAAHLADAGQIVISQRGSPITLDAVSGPIRLGLHQ